MISRRDTFQKTRNHEKDFLDTSPKDKGCNTQLRNQSLYNDQDFIC